MKKFAVFMLLFAGSMTGALLIRANDPEKAPVPNKAPLTTVATIPSKKAYDPPVHLSIPKIGIETDIEQVAMDSEGNMDVPKNADNVGWYTLGYLPGDAGSAVMAGHFDKKDGSPAVFFSLGKLAAGDTISVSHQSGILNTFEVIETASYPQDQLPLQEIFATRGTSILNLITCKGSFNTDTKNYSHRLVVKSRLRTGK